MTLPRRQTSAIAARSRSYRCSSGRPSFEACRRMSNPSAYDCISPYSMPL